MSELELEAEVIQLSIYCETIMTILKQQEALSVIKTMTFTYLIKKNRFYMKDVYTGKNTRGLVTKSLSLMNGLKDDYYRSLHLIAQAIDLLIESNKIEISNEVLIIKDKTYKTTVKENSFFNKSIQASELFTDRQFLKEVLNNV